MKLIDKTRLFSILKISIPATITLVSYMLVEATSTVFNGHLPKDEMISGAGLALMYSHIICLSLAMGMNNTL
jgi:Na+-driven multidrug efflux pump